MKRAIINGATGVIGLALIDELIDHNIEVLVLCRKGSKRIEKIPNHPRVSIKHCSLNQLESLKNNTGKNYDVFYHFAWDGTTGADRNDVYLQNMNVKFSLDAVGVAHRFGCQLFIGAGSQAEYGRVNDVLTPDTPTHPEMGYGIAKLCAGQMTKEYAYQLKMQHIWVRILSVYGPNDGLQSMVMSTISKLKNSEIPKFTKGEQLWDYLYSGDAARAFRLISEKGINGKTYVLGSGNARPLAEYIKDIRDVIAPRSELALGAISYTENQVMHLEADITELRKDTSFTTDIEFKHGIKLIVSCSHQN